MVERFSAAEQKFSQVSVALHCFAGKKLWTAEGSKGGSQADLAAALESLNQDLEIMLACQVIGLNLWRVSWTAGAERDAPFAFWVQQNDADPIAMTGGVTSAMLDEEGGHKEEFQIRHGQLWLRLHKRCPLRAVGR